MNILVTVIIIIVLFLLFNIRHSESFDTSNPKSIIDLMKESSSNVTSNITSKTIIENPMVSPFQKFNIKHVASGKCLHPSGGKNNPDDGTNLVVWNDCSDNDRIKYKWLANGQIQHVSSGKCLHPKGGKNNPDNGNEVVFWNDCSDNNNVIKYKMLQNGQIQHISSGKCLHPSGGKNNPDDGTNIVLWNDCSNNNTVIRYNINPQFNPITIGINDVSYYNIDDLSLNEWMNNLNDNLYLSNLSLPGTHDTMTYAINSTDSRIQPVHIPQGRCQSNNLERQLNGGIRALDIRCVPKSLNPPSMGIHHAFIDTYTTLDTVLDTIVKFLDKNPTEFIIMRVKRENDAKIFENPSALNTDKNYDTIFTSYINNNKYSNYFYTSDNINPTVNNLRKKIYIIQSSPSYGIYHANFNIQDKYELDTNWNLYDKWNNVKNQLELSKNDGIRGKNLFINFLNGSASDTAKITIFPYFVASGKMVADIVDAPQLMTGLTIAKDTDNKYPDFGKTSCAGELCSVPFVGINLLLDEYLEKQPNNIKTGIVMMDFPGTRLIKQIINQNANKKQNFYKPCRFGTKCSYDRGVGRIPNKRSCGPGERDTPTECWLDSYGRGVGRQPDKRSCGPGERDTPTECWLDSYGRGVGRIPSKRDCDPGQRDDGTSCWEDVKCNGFNDNGYYNYSWGSVNCTGGRPFRFEGYNDCYKTWISKLTPNCWGCGCVKKWSTDRQYCNNDEEMYGGLCYPKCKSGYHAVGCCTCEPDGGPRVTAWLKDRQYCNNNEEMYGGLCYPKCKSGYHAVASNICAPEGGPHVTAWLKDRQYCNNDEELKDGLCYKKPNEGFKCGVTSCTKD